MGYYIRASRIEVLNFIRERKIVRYYELAEKFHFSEGYAALLLTRLKKARLVINMTKGCWELTEEGYSRLKYHGRNTGQTN